MFGKFHNQNIPRYNMWKPSIQHIPRSNFHIINSAEKEQYVHTLSFPEISLRSWFGVILISKLIVNVLFITRWMVKKLETECLQFITLIQTRVILDKLTGFTIFSSRLRFCVDFKFKMESRYAQLNFDGKILTTATLYKHHNGWMDGWIILREDAYLYHRTHWTEQQNTIILCLSFNS